MPTPPPDATGTPPSRPLVDVAAPLALWVYVIVQFRPFEALVTLPEGPTALLFPVIGVGVLLISPDERLARLPVSLVLVGLLTWTCLSLAWSEVPAFTLFLIRTQVVSLVVLAAVAGSMPPRTVVRTLTTIAVAITAWSLAVSVMLPTSREVSIADAAAQVGFRGSFGHKNTLGIFVVVGLCLVVAFVRDRRRGWVIALFIVTILGTRSATAAGGLLGVLFVWFWMVAIEQQRTRRERQALLATSVTSAVGGVLLVLGLMPTILNLYDKDLTFSGRTDIWAASVDTIGDQPLHGYGLGGVWSDTTSPVTVDLHRRIKFEAAHAHNSALEILLELGVVGLTLALLLVVQTIRAAVWCLRRPATLRFGQWGLLTSVALLIMGLAEPLFEGAHLGLLVVVAVVLARARIDEAARDRSEAARSALASDVAGVA